MIDIVIPIIRLDRSLHPLHTDLELLASELLPAAGEIINSMLQHCPDSQCSVAVNPLLLAWASHLKNNNDYDCPPEILARLVESLEADSVDLIPSSMVGGLERLVRFDAKLHLNTALSGIFGATVQNPDCCGAAGLSLSDVALIAEHVDANFGFVVCDEENESSAPVARSPDGAICFLYPIEKERALRRVAGDNVIPAALFRSRETQFDVTVVDAADLPSLLSSLHGNARIMTMREASRHILVPPLSHSTVDATPSQGETFYGLDVDELLRRVEDLFVKLVCETVGKSLKMMRDKIFSRDDITLTGSAIGAFLLPDALAEGTVKIRLGNVGAEHSPDVGNALEPLSERATTLESLLAPTPRTGSDSDKSNSLTNSFLDLFAQSLWLHGTRCEKQQVDSEDLSAWSDALGRWLEACLFDTATFAVHKAPRMPKISTLHFLRDSLSWESLKYDNSVVNRHLRELI